MQNNRHLSFSLRQRIYGIAVIYSAIIVLLAGSGMLVSQQASRLLEQAGQAYHQLQNLHQLSNELYHHLNRQLETLNQQHDSEALRASAQRVEASFKTVSMLPGVQSAQDIHQGMQELLLETLYTLLDGPIAESRAALVFYTQQQLLQTHRQRMTPRLEHLLNEQQNQVLAIEDKMLQLQQRLEYVVGLGVLFSIFTAGLLVYWLSNSFLKPLQQLVKATDRLANGQFDTRLPETPGAEFALLGQHFNQMSHKLAQQHQRLEEANSTLEQKVAERTACLQQTNQRLMTIDQHRRRFLEDVSHELRSPVTILLGEADVGLMNPKQDVLAYRQTLRTIRTHCDYLKRRIEDLMALARTQNGELSLQFQRLELNALVRHTTEALRCFAKVRGVNLAVTVPKHPVHMYGDDSWLRQLIMTLVDNAVKFTPADGIVSVTLSVQEQVQIVISDSGIGIAPEQLPHLFERYYQTGAEPVGDSSQQGRSYGLGMAIARWIVEQHQGQVRVDSVRDQGTTVCINFPDMAFITI